MKKEKEVKNYIKKIIEEITTFVPIIQFFQIIDEDENENKDGGEFSVYYQPANYTAEFYIYKSLFDRIPDKGLTEGFKNYIKMGLCHEIGHIFIWELEGTKRDTEKIASLIGFLIFKILEGRQYNYD